jgi:cyclopropane-fatty-acyl-phospholipid synthase
MESEPSSIILIEHDLFRKPVPTFRDHALVKRRYEGAQLQGILRQIFDKVARGQATVLRVVFSDGTTYHNRDAAPDITIIFKTKSAEFRVALLGYVGFFEAYFEGKIDIVGKRALQSLIRMAYSSRYRYVANPLIFILRKSKELRDNNHDFAKAKANARGHYGLPYEFFRSVLGETCLYAEGYWVDGITTLAAAQHERCDYICRKLCLEPGNKLVEVGSGWGYMSIHAAEKYGVNVVNYGLVPEQNVIMQKRIDEHNLSKQIHVVEKDHRDLVNEPNTYDRYVSVGVFEHAGRYCLRSWVESIAAALKPGGIGMISTTAYLHKSSTEYLTIKHVFPGGKLPDLPQILELLDEYDLDVVDVENLSFHYRRTVEEWLDNLEAHWPEIHAINPKLFDEHFFRVWNYYLSGAIENFRPNGGGLCVHHITFTKGRGSYPLNRRFIYVDK